MCYKCMMWNRDLISSSSLHPAKQNQTQNKLITPVMLMVSMNRFDDPYFSPLWRRRTTCGGGAWGICILWARWMVRAVNDCVVLLVFACCWMVDCRCNLAAACNCVCCNWIVFAKTMPCILFKFCCSCCCWMVAGLVIVVVVVFSPSRMAVKLLVWPVEANWNVDSDCCVVIVFGIVTIVGTQTNVCCTAGKKKRNECI